MGERIKVTKLTDRIYLMDDAGESTGYLVVGDEKALVIDTMNGYEDVNEVVKSITDLPIIVANTHGHGDHVLGNVYFEEAYMHPDELQVLELFIHNPEFIADCEKYGLKMSAFKELFGGEVIDLGGEQVDVIHVPGHTKGGLCFLAREERVLFTGDAINRFLWMQLDHSLSMKELVASLENIMYVKEKADKILHGHAVGYEDISLLEELCNAAKDLVAHPQLAETDEDYNWFGGVDKKHVYSDGKVICYSVDKLK